MDRASAKILAPLAVVAAAGALYGLSRLRRTSTPTAAAPEAAFDSALLVLSLPSFLDPKTTIRNDELLAKAVKRACGFYFILFAPPSCRRFKLSWNCVCARCLFACVSWQR